MQSQPFPRETLRTRNQNCLDHSTVAQSEPNLGPPWTFTLSVTLRDGLDSLKAPKFEALFTSIWRTLTGALQTGALLRKLEKAVAVSGVSSEVPEENSRKGPGKIAGKIFPNRKRLQFLGFRAPPKANLPGTLGRHCLDLVHTFRAFFFFSFEIDSSRPSRVFLNYMSLCKMACFCAFLRVLCIFPASFSLQLGHWSSQPRVHGWEEGSTYKGYKDCKFVASLL